MKKGNSNIGFLQRNLRVSNRDTKASAYFTLVRLNIEYCPSVWCPYTDQGKRKIEMVQRRSARYVTNRFRNMSSVTDILEELNWESLESRGTKIQLTLLYKIMNGMVDIPTSPYVTQASARTRSSHTMKLRQISSRTHAYKYSFPSHHPFLELIASFYSWGSGLGILQAGAVHSYILSITGSGCE